MRKKKDGGDEEERETVRTKNEYSYIGNEDVIRLPDHVRLLPLGSPAAPFAQRNQGSS